MSIATVVTRGYGTFGSVNRIPTLGYGGGSGATLVYGPIFAPAATMYVPGAAAADLYQPGAANADVYVPGASN